MSSSAPELSIAHENCSTTSFLMCMKKTLVIHGNRHIFTDHYTGAKAGNSPGYGVTLIAETTNEYNYTVERMAEQGDLPETVGKEASKV